METCFYHKNKVKLKVGSTVSMQIFGLLAGIVTRDMSGSVII